LQTNGLLLDDAWCDFLAVEHFDVGLSIDGPAALHDRYRQDKHGRSSWAGAAAAVRRLQAHGIQPDLLCVVTADSAKEPLAVYRALRDLGTGWIQFIPLLRRTEGSQVTPDSVSSEGYGDFLIAVFDEWLGKDLGQTQVQLFAEMSLVWAGGAATPCQMAPTCGRVLVLERDGSVYACDHFVDPAHRLGDLAHSSLQELADSPAQRRFGDAKRDQMPALCRACPWLAVCNGGCPKDRILPSVQDDFALNYFCPGLRRFFTHAEKPLRQVIELQKKGLPPAAIRAEIRASQLAAWQGVGRNDPCPCGSGRKSKHCCWPKRPV
jgi:uncharacterized protein